MTAANRAAGEGSRPGVWRIGWTAARPQTLGLAATPVIVGIALARAEGAALTGWLALATLLCALLIQIATNLHNDAADFESGNDRADRLGPLRITAAGWATPRQVRRSALLVFTAAFLVGIVLASAGGWPIVAIGLASLAAGWAYSGGPRPISHTPLGEAFVCLFFGLLAVAGSHWLQAGSFSAMTLVAGAMTGYPAAAVLLVNNFRDLEADRRAGRRTLAAALGASGTRRTYAGLLLLPFAGALFLAATYPGSLLVFLALPVAIGLMRRLATGDSGAALNGLLAATARFVVGIGLLLTIAFLTGSP